MTIMIKWLKKVFKIKTVDKVDKTHPVEVNFDEGDTLLLNYPPSISIEQYEHIHSHLQSTFKEYDKHKPKVILIPSNMEIVGVIRQTKIMDSEFKISVEDKRERDH